MATNSPVAALLEYAAFGLWVWLSVVSTLIGLFLLKSLYNLSPIHPLSRYPGPLLWRASRLPASYHHARGDLYQHISRLHTQYGPTVRIAPTELSFTEPNAWTTIYNSRPQLLKSKFHFATSDGQGRCDPSQDGEEGHAVVRRLPDSMIVATDDEHMRLRRLVGPAFLMKGITEVEGVLQLYSDLLCAQLEQVSKETGGKGENMVEWFLWTLNDVIGQLALDQEFECLEKRRMHEWPAFLLRVLKQTAVFNQFRRFGLPLQLLGPFLPKKVIEERDGFFLTAQRAVRRRLAREEEKSGDDSVDEEKQMKRPDIIGLMLREMKGKHAREKMTEPEIMANSILIVGGGAETTSTCLSATLYHLCKTPRVMKRLQGELRERFESLEEITIKATADMPYLRATIDESLRIFPVASYITPRVVGKGGLVIDGEVVPEGTHVSMGQWHMGRSDRFFDDAKEFRPERWLNADETGAYMGGAHHVEGREERMVDEVLRPFSLGPRNCVGKLLAIAEARLVTAKLLWKFDVELEAGQEGWVEGARFYILWELQPLMAKLKAVR